MATETVWATGASHMSILKELGRQIKQTVCEVKPMPTSFNAFVSHSNWEHAFLSLILLKNTVIVVFVGTVLSLFYVHFQCLILHIIMFLLME